MVLVAQRLADIFNYPSAELISVDKHKKKVAPPNFSNISLIKTNSNNVYVISALIINV